MAALNVAEPDLDLSVGTTARKIVDTFSGQLAAGYQSNNVSTSSIDITNLTGAALDNYVAGFGMTRFTAKNSTGLVLISRPPVISAITAPDVIIPGGTIVATTDTNQVTFSVLFTVVLPAADLTIDVPVIAVNGGLSGNSAAGAITVISTPVQGVTSVTNPLAMTGGADAESDAALIARFQANNFRGFTGTVANLTGVALENAAVERVNVIGARSTTQVQMTILNHDGNTLPVVWPYIFTDNMFFGTSIADGEILNPTSQYTATIVAVQAWAPTMAYTANQVVSYLGQLYSAITGFTSGVSFVLANWTSLGGVVTATAPNYYVAITVTAPTQAFVVAAAAATVPSIIITGTNDTFSFGGVVYTVAAGTYSTAATLMTAMGAALAGATALSTVCALTNSSGTFTATSVVPGTPGNGLAFVEDNGFLALSGFGPTQVLAGGSGAPDGIYELQYDYLSSWTRNSVTANILNDVDIWTDGTDIQPATETLPFGVGSGAPSPAGTFTNTLAETYTVGNWIRADGITPPTPGNFFIPLTFCPPISLPPTLSDGVHNHNYVLGTDYWLVFNTGANGWSPHSLAGIEWTAADDWGATGAWTMAVEYDYNAVPTEIETALAGQKLAGAQNTWAHQATEMYLDFSFVVVLVPGYTVSSVLPGVEAALANVCGGLGFSQTLDISEVIAAVQNVNGIQAVRMATPAASTTLLGDQANAIGAGSNGSTPVSFTGTQTLHLGSPLPSTWPISGVVQLFSGIGSLVLIANLSYAGIGADNQSLTDCKFLSGTGPTATLTTGWVVQGPYSVQQVSGIINAVLPITGNIVQSFAVRTDVSFNEVSYPVFNNAFLVVRSQNTFRANETD